MDKQEKIELSKYRLDTSLRLLNVAKQTLDIDTKTSVNRSYYSVFNAMRAILTLDDFDSKKHMGIIARYRQEYVKTGILPTGTSEIIKTLFRIRNDSDYEDFYIISREDAKKQIENAEEFYNVISTYLETRWQSEEQ